MKKLFLAVMLLAAMACHAETITIAHLYNGGHLDSQIDNIDQYSGTISLENLTDVNIHVSTSQYNSFPPSAWPWDVPGGVFGGIMQYVRFPFDTTFAFTGNLASNYFSVGGTQYFVADTNWHSPNVYVDTNEPIYDITVEATAVDAAPVPEPGTMALLGTGLIGFGIRRFRKA